MNNLTHCDGYVKNPLEYSWKKGMIISNSLYDQIKHKKLNVVYSIVSRYKVSPGFRTNTESIRIAIDSNFSTDFSLDYVDLFKQESFRIYIESIYQPSFDNTICFYVIEYINPQQEILRKKDSFRVPTIKGTIEKKLFEIKKYFDEYSQKELENFINNGFHMPVILLAQLVAEYGKKHLKELNVREIYDYSHYLKPLLFFYSMIADDCFLTSNHNSKRLSYYFFPFHLSYLDNYKQDNSFLLSEQIDLIHKLTQFILNNRSNIEKIRKIADVEKQDFGYSEYFDYFILKEEFLKIYLN